MGSAIIKKSHKKKVVKEAVKSIKKDSDAPKKSHKKKVPPPPLASLPDLPPNTRKTEGLHNLSYLSNTSSSLTDIEAYERDLAQAQVKIECEPAVIGSRSCWSPEETRRLFETVNGRMKGYGESERILRQNAGLFPGRTVIVSAFLIRRLIDSD